MKIQIKMKMKIKKLSTLNKVKHLNFILIGLEEESDDFLDEISDEESEDDHIDLKLIQ